MSHGKKHLNQLVLFTEQVTHSKIGQFAFFWAKRDKVTYIMHMTEVSSPAIADWYNFLRDVCSKEILAIEMKVNSTFFYVVIVSS